MQGGRSASALESAKEAAANVGASAWAGKEKAKAVVQEKAAKARAHDPEEKAAADARMQDRVRKVEVVKQDAMRQNAAAKERATAAGHHPTPLGVGGRAAGTTVPAPVTGVAGGAGAVDDRSSLQPTTTTDGGHAGTDAPPVPTTTNATTGPPAVNPTPTGVQRGDEAGFTGTDDRVPPPPATGTAGAQYN